MRFSGNKQNNNPQPSSGTAGIVNSFEGLIINKYQVGPLFEWKMLIAHQGILTYHMTKYNSVP